MHEGAQFNLSQPLEAMRNDRQLMMRIRGGVAVAWEMLAAGKDAVVLESGNDREAQRFTSRTGVRFMFTPIARSSLAVTSAKEYASSTVPARPSAP